MNPKLMINTYAEAGVDMIASESSASVAANQEWNYSATDNVKRILGSYRDRSPGNLLIYFQDIGFRHIGTSPNLAKVWMLENMLHGAPLGFVVIGTLVNYEDRIFIPTLNDLYGFHKTHERLFTNLESVARVGLIRGSGDEYRGMMKLLTEEHIPYDIIEPSVAGTERTPRRLDPRALHGYLALGSVPQPATIVDGVSNARTPMVIPAGLSSIGVNPVTNKVYLAGTGMATTASSFQLPKGFSRQKGTASLRAPRARKSSQKTKVAKAWERAVSIPWRPRAHRKTAMETPAVRVPEKSRLRTKGPLARRSARATASTSCSATSPRTSGFRDTR